MLLLKSCHYGKVVCLKGNMANFPLVNERVQGATLAQDFITDVADHLSQLENDISWYLGELKS